jgi:hypothetical protein
MIASPTAAPNTELKTMTWQVRRWVVMWCLRSRETPSVKTHWRWLRGIVLLLQCTGFHSFADRARHFNLASRNPGCAYPINGIATGPATIIAS